MKKSREGRQKCGGRPQWCRAQAPFVPGGTLDDGGRRVPAMNGWAIVRGSGATPETATGTGARPGNVPARQPIAGWGGRMGQWAFENPERILAFSPALRGTSYAGWRSE